MLMPPPKFGEVFPDQVQPSNETMELAIHCAPPPVADPAAELFWKVQDLNTTFEFTSVMPPPRKASCVTPSAKMMNSKVICRARSRLEGAMRRMSVVSWPEKATAAPGAARTVKPFGVGRS